MQCCAHEVGEARHASQSSGWRLLYPKVMVSKKEANTAQKQKSVSVNFVLTLELQFSAKTECSARLKVLGDGSSELLMFVQHVKATTQFCSREQDFPT